ncbi:glycerophosphodiester phosphodiesterase family protein [Ruania halotolerans]|uniref:glycerophosphodiester phosphodiesterase family protein n=1 Tax=Ruania halotolerans TaxID=2897773 RepID=UPI001E411F10|nr:glycerophosphodiester phosphodiesterase family protein [Ruania halotolerans]UFU04892.1 glycerophosphodiester phosphodiesterase [Ruania halotolerans]
MRLPPGPLALAHRGGAGLPANAGIENSLTAIRNAVELGYTYIETDVRASSDGVPFIVHDADLRRITGDARQVADLSAAELRAATLTGGAAIPTLAEMLEEFGHLWVNLDLKSDDVVEPAIEVVRSHSMGERVVVASFSTARLLRVRRMAPELATSATPREVAAMLMGRSRSAARNGAVAVQVPRRWRGIEITTPAFIRRVHRQGMQVHVWTIDDVATIRTLLDRGVDAIVSDRVDVLREVLMQRGQWPAPPRDA